MKAERVGIARVSKLGSRKGMPLILITISLGPRRSGRRVAVAYTVQHAQTWPKVWIRTGGVAAHPVRLCFYLSTM